MLSTGELAALQADFAQLLDEDAVVLTAALAPDGKGHDTTTWPEPGTAVRAHRADRPVTTLETTRGSRVVSATSWYISLPRGTAVAPPDRIRFTDGSVYEVQAVVTRKTWLFLVRVQAEQVAG